VPHIWLALLALISTTTPVDVKGTICRLNRRADRMIVRADDGTRMNVLIGDSSRVTFEKDVYDADDLRPGDRVRIVGRQSDVRVDAEAVDVQLKVAETIVDALLGLKPPLVGRFATREAKTEFFSFHLPGGRYIRVDAKSAYGPKGRVWVSTLRSGDLLELSGEWKSDSLYRASGIRILTDEESSKCRAAAGETKEQKAERQTADQKFLEGSDPISDEELARLLAEDEVEAKGKEKEKEKPKKP
jgi:hypothetical protein